jgi:hypothetical protein
VGVEQPPPEIDTEAPAFGVFEAPLFRSNKKAFSSTLVGGVEPR